MIKNVYRNKILILDFGSQYAQLMVRRIREIGVYCELWAWSMTKDQIRAFNPNGIILSGGPESAVEKRGPRVSDYIFQAGVPVLGVCYGMQIMAVQLGGKVQNSFYKEFGSTKVEILINNSLIEGLQDEVTSDGKPILNVWMSHNDIVAEIPSGFTNVARTKTCPFAIIAQEEKNFYGIQFHPEVTHTQKGQLILKRFAFNICGCSPLWKPITITEEIINYIRKKVGNEKVILGLSGGIDSLVTAVLVQRAIGDRLICIFVDNGLLRDKEAHWVLNVIGSRYGLNIVSVLEEDRFFSALLGIVDPEIKRKIIGRVFIEIFEEQAIRMNNVKWLAQGTIYSDVIESSSSISDRTCVIKSHHNVGGLPKKISLKLLEPLKRLFKDEVRQLGLDLRLPNDILYRHPFPGPGLSVRILGEVKKEYCNLVRHADAIFIEELRKADLYRKVSQAFVVFLPVRSVSIVGDYRKYNWVVSLRAIETVDFMTARWFHLPHKFLELVSSRITNEVNNIARVVYDISNKPPATVEWE